MIQKLTKKFIAPIVREMIMAREDEIVKLSTLIRASCKKEEKRSKFNENIDTLRAATKFYHDTECEILTTTPGFCEADVENYSDSYKWLSFPIRGECPETVPNMIASKVEDFPNDCLAGILAAVLKNQVPTGVRVRGLSIDRTDTSFHFCISGSTSLEDIRTLAEQYKHHGNFQVEK